MPFDTLRKSNPHMAHMNDDQICASIGQMERMAEDPAMLKMAAEQMKLMSPEQFESMKQMAGGTVNTTNGGSSSTASSPNVVPTDTSKMMEALLSNPEQLSSMIKTMKQNPELMKQMMSSQMLSGDANGSAMMSDDAKRDQLEKAVDQFAQMDDKQLEQYLKLATKVQTGVKPFYKAWNGTTRVLGVSSKNLFIVINLFVLVSFTLLVMWKRSSAVDVEDGTAGILEGLEMEEVPEIGEGYGGGEF